jgi:hypothetical protein
MCFRVNLYWDYVLNKMHVHAEKFQRKHSLFFFFAIGFELMNLYLLFNVFAFSSYPQYQLNGNEK